MKLTKLNFLLLVILLAVINFTYLNVSLSVGDRYFQRLQHWYFLAQKGDWPAAAVVATKLDSADIFNYSRFHEPSELQKTIDQIRSKENKTADDWVEIANLEKSIGHKAEASAAATQAHQLDPVRDDITQLYYQLSK